MRVRLPIASVTAALAAAVLAGCAPDAPSGTPSPSPTAEASPRATPSPTTTPDPYAGYFDDRADGGPAFAVFRGSFGDVGAVAAIRNELRTIPAGRYDVEVVCVGPPAGVEVTLTSIADEAVLREVTVGCSADGVVGRTDTVELAGQGLRVELDSGGDAGAYFVAVRAAAG